LLDCGPGVFGKLREAIDYLAVDAVLISHMHGDHFLDLIPYSYALSYSPRQYASDIAVRPPLHVPPGGRTTLRTVMSGLGDAELIERAFALSEYDPVETLTLGPLTIQFAEVPHFVRTHAVDITCADGSRLTFSADCGPNDALAELARDTDLLLVEATLADGPEDGYDGHMTASQAAAIAVRAHAGRMLITHVSDEFRHEAVLAAAQAGFDGPVDLARSGEVHTLERP
jgi:ribonuclease BN (tRNA processing enzyme)